jgi:hypothetical protein
MSDVNNIYLVSGVISINEKASVIETDNVKFLLRHETILKLTYHILQNREMDFKSKILSDDFIKTLIERTWEVDIESVDFGMFFIYNSTLKNIGYTFHARNIDDINFNNIVEHLLLICKTNLDDFGKKFTEHRLSKDVYDSSLIKLFTASEESKTPN